MKKLLFFIGTTGIILLGTAIFAEQIGIDNNHDWGKGRILFLMAGFFLILAGSLIASFQSSLLKLIDKMSVSISYSNQIRIFSFLATLIVIAFYIWIISPSFDRPNTNYYSQLAIAFKRNQVYLPEQPSAALLSLSDPYDYTLRKNSAVEDFPWDVSLYKGKYYIYWGPVPALFLTALSSETLANLGDQHLVFVFLGGLFLYSTLLATSIWLKFNYNLPSWMIGAALLAVGISVPATLMLNNPKIYEAAIAGCQFFFSGGCYWAYSAINREDSPSTSKLAMASLHWALALGTRVMILPATIFTVAVTFIYILRKNKTTNLKKVLLAMIPPFLITAVGLSWYNWIRFESIFEFGMRFQLASINYSEFNNLFSVRYIHENLLNYFISPHQIQTTFPYIKSIENIIWNERLVGLLYTSPYFLLSFIPMNYLLYSVPASKKNGGIDQDNNSLQKWVVTIFTGSSLFALGIILSYYFTAMRFAEDFMPALLLLSTVHLGQGYKIISGNKKLSNAYIFFTTLIIIFSIIASTLIALPESRVKSMRHNTKQTYELLGIR